MAGRCALVGLTVALFARKVAIYSAVKLIAQGGAWRGVAYCLQHRAIECNCDVINLAVQTVTPSHKRVMERGGERRVEVAGLDH